MNFRNSLTVALCLVLTSTSLGVTQCGGLDAWYRSYNDMYFQGKLAKDTTIVRAKLKQDAIAITMCDDKGAGCTIMFNEDYRVGPSFEHQVLKHEMCHVWSWIEDARHGKTWVKCMKSLRAQGSFDQDEIYNSTGEGPENPR